MYRDIPRRKQRNAFSTIARTTYRSVHLLRETCALYMHTRRFYIIYRAEDRPRSLISPQQHLYSGLAALQTNPFLHGNGLAASHVGDTMLIGT